jgi:iron complex transport system substrate-binding protein
MVRSISLEKTRMKFRHLPVVILVTLTLIGIAPLAAQDNATEYPVTVIDATGAEVTVDARPERVMCLFTDCIQNLAVLDILPAGAFEFDKRISSSPGTFGDRAEEITAFAWGDAGPDAEALLDFAPDFFVMEGAVFGYAPQLEVFTDTTTVYFSSGPYVDRTQSDINDPEVWADFTADLRNFGIIFDRQEQANAFIERLQNRIEAYSQIVNPDARYARVRLEADMSIFAPPCMGLMREMATCVSFGDEWIQTTVEALLDLNPDVIIVEDSPDREIDLDAWAEVPLWSELSAVQNDRVFIVPYDSFYDATPLSLSNTMDAILPLLNSDVLPDGPLTDAQVQDILAGDEESSEVTYPRTVIDGLGREVTLSAPPERVLCFMEQCVIDLAMVDYLPDGVYFEYNIDIAGFPELFGEAVSQIELVGTVWEVDYEAVAAWRPDLIIVGSDDPALSGIAPTFTYASDGGGTEAEVVQQAVAVADAVGRRVEAETSAAYLQDRIAAYRVLIPAERATYLPVSVNIPETAGAFVWVPPCGQLDDFVDCLNDGSDWIQVTAEGLISLDPDLIAAEDFNGTVADEIEVFAEVNAALWSEIRAAQQGRFIPVNFLAVRPETLLGMSVSLDILMPLLYPDIFPAPLTDEQVQKILAGAENEYPREVIHATGMTRIQERPVRIYDISYHGLWVLLSFRVPPIEYQMHNDRIAEFRATADVLGVEVPMVEMGAMPNIELIAQASPDLILGADVYTNEIRSQLEAIAPVVDIPGPGLGGWRENVRIIGDVLAMEDEAEAFIAETEHAIATSLSAYDLPEDASFAFVAPGLYDGLIYICQDPTYAPIEILLAAGLIMTPEVAGLTGNVCTGVSLELITETLADTDVIVLNAVWGTNVDEFLSVPVIAAIPAVAQGNYYVIEGPSVATVTFDVFSPALIEIAIPVLQEIGALYENLNVGGQ